MKHGGQLWRIQVWSIQRGEDEGGAYISGKVRFFIGQSSMAVVTISVEDPDAELSLQDAELALTARAIDLLGTCRDIPPDQIPDLLQAGRRPSGLPGL